MTTETSSQSLSYDDQLAQSISRAFAALSDSQKLLANEQSCRSVRLFASRVALLSKTDLSAAKELAYDGFRFARTYGVLLTEAFAELLVVRGQVHQRLGEYVAARNTFESALEICQAVNPSSKLIGNLDRLLAALPIGPQGCPGNDFVAA